MHEIGLFNSLKKTNMVQKQPGLAMKKKHIHLFSVVKVLLLTIMTIPDAEAATNIPPDVTVSGNDSNQYNFTTPNGLLTIGPSGNLTMAVTNNAAGDGIIVFNGGQIAGQIGTPTSPVQAITLNANGTITGQTSSSTFNLGQNTLTQNGALALNSGSLTLNTKVITNALFGNIAVTGANTFSGPSVTVNVDASGVVALTPGAPLFIVGAQGTTTAVPVIVTSNNVLYSFTGLNLNGNIEIFPTLNPAVPIPSSGVGSVFTALLTVAANNPGSDIATVVAAISALPTSAAIAAALAQLNPNVNGAIPRASFAGAQQFQNLWSKHMGYGRCIYATDCCTDPKSPKDGKNPCLEKRPEKACWSEINCSNVPNRFEVWVDGFGYWGRQNAHHDFEAYKDDIYGGMIGFQAPLTRELSIGFGAGYAWTSILQNDNKNDGHIQTYDATLYAAYDSTHWFLDAAFSFDYNYYHSSRHIFFPGIDRTATSNYNGKEYTALGVSGYRWYTNDCFIITPFAGLQYSYLDVSKYREHGAGDIDLHVNAQHYDFLESSLGLEFSRPIQTRHGAFVPEVHGIWLHDFYGDAMDLNTIFSSVASEAGRFTTKGPAWARNSWDVGGSIAFITCNRWSIELVYNYEFSSTYHANEGLFKLSKRF